MIFFFCFSSRIFFVIVISIMTLVQDLATANIEPSLNGNGIDHVVPAPALYDLKNAPVTEVKSIPQDATTEAPATKPRFELEEHPVDQVRDIKVGVIGAGLSGVLAGVLLPAKLPGLDLRIYDKNPDVVSPFNASTIARGSKLTCDRVALGMQ